MAASKAAPAKGVAAKPWDSPELLYRCYDADGELIYIGRTGEPTKRFSHHRVNTRWWGEVDHFTVEVFASTGACRDAETEAIFKNRPRHNQKYAERQS